MPVPTKLRDLSTARPAARLRAKQTWSDPKLMSGQWYNLMIGGQFVREDGSITAGKQRMRLELARSRPTLDAQWGWGPEFVGKTFLVRDDAKRGIMLDGGGVWRPMQHGAQVAVVSWARDGVLVANGARLGILASGKIGRTHTGGDFAVFVPENARVRLSPRVLAPSRAAPLSKDPALKEKNSTVESPPQLKSPPQPRAEQSKALHRLPLPRVLPGLSSTPPALVTGPPLLTWVLLGILLGVIIVATARFAPRRA